ncbi:aromatic ring-hydroxylating oxygenase subunit alpha [Novosphingobium aquimarinum]|uniref:aromatic ring-hydroxylating oxygenase subunit alpha n=1 Tax=Novosphingobium aquimarinum TaxID=2682494 RepID=UPI0012EC544C|nr:aromatic ring-hydroxylating dioxygenase subunit alpha [Novosphingobium aquimarinum]
MDPILWNDWHVVADATALQCDRPITTRLLGVPLTVSRDAQGAVHVVGTDGSPIVSDVRHGFVWACLGKPARPILSIAELAEPDRCVTTAGSFGVHVSAGRVIENFLDLGHLGHVHAGYLGQEPQTAVEPYEVARLPDGGVHASGCKVFQPVSSPTAQSGFVVEYQYKVERALTASLYKSSFSQPDRFDVIYLFAQPLDEEHAIAHVLEIFIDDGVSPAALRAFQQFIFLQDKPILENQIPKRLPIGQRMEMPVLADKTSVAYRRWLAELGVTYGTVGAHDGGLPA